MSGLNNLIASLNSSSPSVFAGDQRGLVSLLSQFVEKISNNSGAAACKVGDL